MKNPDHQKTRNNVVRALGLVLLLAIAPTGAQAAPASCAQESGRALTLGQNTGALPQKVDLKTAQEMVRPQADAGHSLAQFALGYMYVMQRDYPNAADWLARAAAQGNACAQMGLAGLHMQGLGLPKNPDEAVRLMHAAADQGLPEAQYNLAVAYYRGDGVGVDATRALELLKAASMNGHADAALEAGKLISKQGSPKEAIAWYRRGAALGNVSAQMLTGLSYTIGKDVPQDRVEAYAWLTAAKNRVQGKDLALAEEMIGVIEKGLTPDEIEGLKRAATSRRASAQREALQKP